MTEELSENFEDGGKRWDAVLEGLPYQGRFEFEALKSVADQLMAYEDWIGEGQPRTIDHVLEQPRWFLGAAYWNPIAFEFMRHSAMTYLHNAQTAGQTYGGTFLSLIRRVREKQADEFNDLVEATREAFEEFDRQHNNARRNHKRIANANEEERLEIALQWYVSFFETNLYLWFLCVLGRFVKTGQLEPRAFGGPLTTVAQGELVNKAMEGFEGTPLRWVIGWVFDTELRNSIGHNDYELAQDGSQTLILHPSGRTMTRDESWRFLMLAQTFHQGMLNAISKLITFPDPDHWRFLREYGVIALDWHVPKEGPVETILYQLWCFAELDADGSWLDTAEFTICEFAGDALDGRRAVRFGSVGFLDVPDTPFLDALQSKLEEEPWLLVTRYPVAPHLGLGYPRYRDEFEIVGVPEEHLVHYAGEGTIDPSNLPPEPSQ